ncbi:MAG TPA: solute carrier family 23 protein, partial [Rubrivivax sp.]|nr:solute carrier family 23 protein [Rubrivivax sp.]
LGLKSAGIVVGNAATLVALGSLENPNAWVAIIGLLGTAVLMYKKVKGAILYGIIGTSLIAILTPAHVYVGADGKPAAFQGFADGLIGVPVWPSDLIGHLDIGAALGVGLFSVVFPFFFVDFFDATGTLTGLAQRAGYLDADGDMPRARLTFSMDGLAAMFGAFVGTSTTTAYVESASGIEEGGKTGVTASTVGVLFILSTFLWPIAGAVPARSARTVAPNRHCAPSRCACAFSACANWRQLTTPAVGRRIAARSGTAASSPGSSARARSPSSSSKATPSSASRLIGARARSRSCLRRSSTSAPSARSVSSPSSACSACSRAWPASASRSSRVRASVAAAPGRRLRRWRHAQRASPRPASRGGISTRPSVGPGPTSAGATRLPLAKLAPPATASPRSNTMTSWPSAASSYAVVTPTMPAPTIAIRTSEPVKICIA